jgi:FdhE protein
VTARGARLAEHTRDRSTAPLARLLSVALRAADDPAWADAVPALDPSGQADGVPILHGAEVALDPRRAARLLGDLTRSVAAPQLTRIDPLALIEASITQSTDRLAALADAADVDADVLAIVAHALSLPLLLAVGRAVQARNPAAAPTDWEAGHCPVCAAWPTVVEVRGLDRERWLRCGRCGAGWPFPSQRCPHCGESDHRKLGYLAPAADRESRRAETCDTCHAYVKAVTVLAATPPPDLPALDLDTLALDIAAIDRGYGRPAEPAFPLALRVSPTATGHHWLVWRR